MIRAILKTLLLLQLTLRVDAFAAWLKCFVDLDETEIIMNYPILTPDKAPHLVEVQVKYPQDEEWSTNLSYTAYQPAIVHARLKVPKELEREDVQYVMETTNGGTFNPGLCDGVRGHGSRHNEEVGLELSGKEDQVELWAGWATGHGQVSLTPRTKLRKEGTEAVEL